MANPQLRRKPQQSRSRVRVEAILDITDSMLQESGSDAFAMRELARRADIPISSVYQYFSNKGAIVRCLIERHNQRFEDHLQSKWFAMVAPWAELDIEQRHKAINGVINTLWLFYREQASYQALWSGVQSDPALQQLEAQDSCGNAAKLANVMAEFFPQLDDAQRLRISLLLYHMISGGLALALRSPAVQQQGLITELQAMISRYLQPYLLPYQAIH